MDISTLENERKRAIQQQGEERISGGWNVANMRSSPYADFEPFDDGYDDIESYRGKPVFGVEEDGQMYFDFPFVQAPNNMMMAHHTGGKHFTEPTVDELIQGIINGDVPRGTLGDEETENRMIQEYLLRQQQASNEMLIASHDRPKFKTPPAPGSGAANADNIANDLLIRAVTGGLIKPSTPNNLRGI